MPTLTSSDGQLFDLSEPAAQLSQTLRNTLDDTTGDAPVPVPLGSEALANIAKFLERKVAVLESLPDERRAELRERGLPRAAALDADPDAVTEAALDALAVDGLSGAARLLCDLRWFDAALPTTILAEHVARLLRGQTADALRELLGEADDLNADEKRAALAEPLYVQAALPAAAPAVAPEVAPAAVPAPPQPTRSISLAMDDSDPFEGNMMACLERCDARTLRELKAVSVAWWRRAREVLGDPASAWRQRPIWSPSAKGRELAAQLGCEDTTERRRVLRRMRDEKLDPGVDLPGHAWAIVPLLESTGTTPKVALDLLGQLEAAILAQHAAAIIAKLTDSEHYVRTAAVETLGKLEAAALAQHVAAVIATLTDSERGVRRAAVETLRKLEGAALAQHVAVVIAVLKDRVWDVRRAALHTLGKLEAAVLAQHAAAIIATSLEDREWSVRIVAVETLGKLDAAALAPHEAALVAKLAVTHAVDPNDDMAHVAHAALEVLAKLGAEKIAQHAAAIAAKLEDSSWLVRVAALQTLGKLEAADLAQHAAAIVATLEGSKSDNQPGGCSEAHVRKAAVETLGKLDVAALAQNAAALVATLVNAIYGAFPGPAVAVLETLGKLGAEALAEHEHALAKVAKEDKSQAVRRTACLVMHTLKPSAGYDTYAKLDDSVWEVRVAAVETLSKLDATALAPYLPAIVAKLEDSVCDVRKAAVETLSQLDAADLAPYLPAIVTKLDNHHPPRPPWMPRGCQPVARPGTIEAMKVLGKLDAPDLAQHAAAIVAKLTASDEDVRTAAWEVLSKLGVEETLAQHADIIAAKLADSDTDVRKAACFVMHKLKPSAGFDTVAKLVDMSCEDSDADTRLDAVKTLGKLDAATLTQHEQSLAKVAKNPWEEKVVREAAAQLLAELRGESGSHQ